MKGEELNLGVFLSLSMLSLVLISLVFIFPNDTYAQAEATTTSYQLDAKMDEACTSGTVDEKTNRMCVENS